METIQSQKVRLLATLVLCLTANGTAYAESFSDFRKEGERFIQQEKQDFAQYKKELQAGFAQYRRITREAFGRYKQTIKKQWKDPEVSDRKKWVEYTPDFKIGSTRDRVGEF